MNKKRRGEEEEDEVSSGRIVSRMPCPLYAQRMYCTLYKYTIVHGGCGEYYTYTAHCTVHTTHVIVRIAH